MSFNRREDFQISLEGMHTAGVNMKNGDLTAQTFKNGSHADGIFSRAKFLYANCDGTQFKQCVFTEASMIRAVFSEKTQFTACDVERLLLLGAKTMEGKAVTREWLQARQPINADRAIITIEDVKNLLNNENNLPSYDFLIFAAHQLFSAFHPQIIAAIKVRQHGEEKNSPVVDAEMDAVLNHAFALINHYLTKKVLEGELIKNLPLSALYVVFTELQSGRCAPGLIINFQDKLEPKPMQSLLTMLSDKKYPDELTLCLKDLSYNEVVAIHATLKKSAHFKGLKLILKSSHQESAQEIKQIEKLLQERYTKYAAPIGLAILQGYRQDKLLTTLPMPLVEHIYQFLLPSQSVEASNYFFQKLYVPVGLLFFKVNNVSTAELNILYKDGMKAFKENNFALAVEKFTPIRNYWEKINIQSAGTVSEFYKKQKVAAYYNLARAQMNCALFEDAKANLEVVNALQPSDKYQDFIQKCKTALGQPSECKMQ